MWSRTWIFLIMCKVITRIAAQEFQVTVYSERNFEGTSTVLNITGCFQLQDLDGLASVNVTNACAILYKYDDGDCSSEDFAIIPPNDSIGLDLIKLDFQVLVNSVSRCNYCPPEIQIGVHVYSFFVSDHKAVSGHHWLYNTAEFDNPPNQTNICGQILDDFPIPFISVVSGCVQYYSSNDCTTAEPEINRFQSIHGVREWDTLRPVKSFSHCFLHCVPELSRNYVGIRGKYVEEEEPAFSGVRVFLSSGLRKNVYSTDLDVGRCHTAPGIDVSTVTRVVAKDICIVLYAKENCNVNRIVSKPTVLEAKGDKVAAISIPDLFRELPDVKSYMLCETLVNVEDYHLVLANTRFFNDYTTTNTITIFNSTEFKGVRQVVNISECTVLPHRLTTESSIESHGKCISLFVEKNCTGNYEKLEIGSPLLRYMGLLDSIESYQSIELCSNNAPLTTELDLQYNFTLSKSGSHGYNWTFSSLANQSDVCWELPYVYHSTTHHPAVVVNKGCLKVFVGLQCSPFSEHFTIATSSNSVRKFSNWRLHLEDLRSFTSCADLVQYPRIQSTVPRQNINFPYNYPNGSLSITTSGEVSQNWRLEVCEFIPRDFDFDSASQSVDELSLVYVKNECIFIFDQQDCTMSENTTLPIILNATDRPLETNLTKNPFWGKPVSVVSSIECDNFINEYKDLERIFLIESERRSAKNSPENSTRDQTISMDLSSLFGTLVALGLLIVILVFGLGVVIYVKVKNFEKNKLSSIELDLFYKGSDGPSTSNEDAIQNTAVNKSLEIPSTNFTYAKSDNGSPIVLGSGCFGKVIRGILHTGFDELNNCQLTRNVAIKIPKIGITLDQIRSLLCEIKICAFVEKHKNIVEFVGFCIEDIDLGKISIILELCENGSLLHYLRDNAKDFQSNCKTENVEQTPTELTVGCNEDIKKSLLLRWCQEIAEAMEFLSSKNVLHADLATRNCLLDSNLQIKVTDFGLSRKLYDYGIYVKKSKAKLPWCWMALESLKSFTFSVKTDVWSYGVCLWEIFSFGDTPYPTLTFDEDFIKNLSSGLRLSKPDVCPEYCYQLMLKCWHEDPNERNDFGKLRTAISDFRREMFCNNVVDDDHSGLYAVLE